MAIGSQVRCFEEMHWTPGGQGRDGPMPGLSRGEKGPEKPWALDGQPSV